MFDSGGCYNAHTSLSDIRRAGYGSMDVTTGAQSSEASAESRVSGCCVRDRLSEGRESAPIQGAVSLEQASTPVKTTTKKVQWVVFVALLFFGIIPAFIYLGFIGLQNWMVSRSAARAEDVVEEGPPLFTIISATEEEVAAYHQADPIKKAEALKALKVFRAQYI